MIGYFVRSTRRVELRRTTLRVVEFQVKSFKRERGWAEEVSKSLLHFNGMRYDLERFVVMPNHAHVLIQMRSGYELRKEFSGIMRFTGRAINRLMSKTGEFWQSEPFDHIVRNEDQFRYLQNYILENPLKARLREGESLFWCHDSESRVT